MISRPFGQIPFCSLAMAKHNAINLFQSREQMMALHDMKVIASRSLPQIIPMIILTKELHEPSLNLLSFQHLRLPDLDRLPRSNSPKQGGKHGEPLSRPELLKLKLVKKI